MEITGRLTADAIISTTKSDKQVVNFSIAVNDRFKNKSGEVNTITEYFRCAFWLGTNVAKVLTKGTIVNLNGRAFTNAWIGADGEAKSALNFNTSNIKILGGGKKQNPSEQATGKESSQGKARGNADDDLPF